MVGDQLHESIFVKPPNDPNGATNEPKLWLNSVTQKNAAGTEALPAV